MSHASGTSRPFDCAHHFLADRPPRVAAASAAKRKLVSLPMVLALCLACGVSARAGDTSSAIASAHTSTYVFIPDQSTILQTGGIAGVHRTYTIEGSFQLSIDLNANTATFASVDANAIDDSDPRLTLDPNEVFSLTTLPGMLTASGAYVFRGRAADGSSINIILTFRNDLAHLSGQTMPPPDSADFLLFSIDATTRRKYGGGTGEPNDPYLIYTAAQLRAIGGEPDDWDRHFKLMNDLDMTAGESQTLKPIGLYSQRPFSGHFDGSGHTISHLMIRETGLGPAGLFGHVRRPPLAGDFPWPDEAVEAVEVIRDLGLIDPNVQSPSNLGVGALVGCLSNGKVSSCYVKGGSVKGANRTGGLIGAVPTYNIPTPRALCNCSVQDCDVQGWSTVGGLVGEFGDGRIEGCWSIARVRGEQYVGGLVGHLEMWGEQGDDVSRCWSSGTVEGASEVGGLVGMRWGSGAIAECYSTAVVQGGFMRGGLVGHNVDGTIANCYAIAPVSGLSQVGGLVGAIQGTISTCYAAGLVQGDTEAGGLVGSVTADPCDPKYLFRDSFWDIYTSGQGISAGGTNKTTAEMQTPATFLEAGWDFVDETENGADDIWWIREGQDYPRLSWERFMDDVALFVVDDFEDYNDVPGYEIWNTWIEPFDLPVSGAQVGHALPPYAETTLLHGGSQSMPFYYRNKNNVVNSRAQRAFHPAQDWTTNGADTLALWFRGAADNGIDAFYLTVWDSANKSATLFNPDPNAVVNGMWAPWHISLSDLTTAGLDTRRIGRLEIGVGDRTKPSREAPGLLYIDDIATVMGPAPEAPRQEGPQGFSDTNGTEW